MRIGITDCFKEDKFQQYAAWMKATAPDVELATLSYELNNAGLVNELDGLLLTGGGDVHPKLYGKAHRLESCRGVDERRDEFEFATIDNALDANVPILGVCRGMQVMNVFLGGSLHVDLVEAGREDHTSSSHDSEARHLVSVVAHSTLQSITGVLDLRVNSFHHQAVDKLGNALVASAVSADGVIEAAEWALKADMPFLVLVQWHPERDAESIVSRNLAGLFIREVRHSQRMKTTT